MFIMLKIGLALLSKLLVGYEYNLAVACLKQNPKLTKIDSFDAIPMNNRKTEGDTSSC